MDFPHAEVVYLKREISDDDSKISDNLRSTPDIIKEENLFFTVTSRKEIKDEFVKPDKVNEQLTLTQQHKDDKVKLESPPAEECNINDEALITCPFKCKLCLKMFTRKGRLNRHMKTHTGEKPFACRICSKKFSEYGNLHRHMQIHTGDKPFECEFCSNKFSRKANAQRHMRTHIGEKPYACTMCNKHFSELGHLKEHMRMHTATEPLVCEVCQRKFLWKTSLKRHMNIHTHTRGALKHVKAVPEAK